MKLNLDLFNKNNEKKLESSIVADKILCTIKWFCKKKGYGFALPGYNLSSKHSYIDTLTNSEVHDPDKFFKELKLKEVLNQDIDTEIFVHLSKVNSNQFFTTATIKEGDILLCKILRSIRGIQVIETYESFSMQKPISDIIVCNALIKWFNEKEDFGFLRVDLPNFKKDIFLPGKKIRELGLNLSELLEQKKVLCSFIIDNGKGIIVRLVLDKTVV